MLLDRTNTVVVGGGQAGLAMSEHLRRHAIPHLVLERDRLVERWRSERWDSLVANGPAWHDRFPGLEFSGISPDDFATKEHVVEYFLEYAKKIKAPVHCGVEVTNVKPNEGRSGFRVVTTEGVLEAENVVAATGPFQNPVFPPIVPSSAQVLQIHSNAYRNPGQLPPGSVLIVGAGSSGVQIADELMHAGRRVYLSVGPHERPPRRYRGRDFVWWLGVLGKWEATTAEPGKEHVTIAVSGARGGHSIDFRRLAHSGLTLLGMTKTFQNGVLSFASDLAANLAHGDAQYLSMLDEADAYVARHGLDLPEEPTARHLESDPSCVKHPILELELAQAEITTILWATGYTVDYSWLEIDSFDERGRPLHRNGVSREPGVYFLGLPWQVRRGSSFIWGVWHDAGLLADQIAIKRQYIEYKPTGPTEPTKNPEKPA